MCTALPPPAPRRPEGIHSSNCKLVKLVPLGWTSHSLHPAHLRRHRHFVDQVLLFVWQYGMQAGRRSSVQLMSLRTPPLPATLMAFATGDFRRKTCKVSLNHAMPVLPEMRRS